MKKGEILGKTAAIATAVYLGSKVIEKFFHHPQDKQIMPSILSRGRSIPLEVLLVESPDYMGPSLPDELWPSVYADIVGDRARSADMN